MRPTTVSALLAAVSLADAYSLSDYPNLQEIYNKYKADGSDCSNVLQDGFQDDGGSDTFRYCGDLGSAAMFLQRQGGGLDNMDIDCDGANLGAGACSNDPSGQGITAFQDLVAQYSSDAGTPINDLDANVHPYVVFGNEGSSPTFDPQDYGMAPLSVMAVVCGDQVHYGVWGDTNGGTSTGESSIAMANLCFPDDGLNGDNGHGPNDVLYIGFTDPNAWPGANGQNQAAWDAGDAQTFEESIRALGDDLVGTLGSGLC